KTLLGFFQRTPSTGGAPPATSASRQIPSSPAPSKNRPKSTATSSASSLTPAPSSDGPGPEDEDDNVKASVPPTKGLPSPVSADEGQTNGLDELNARGTPSRRAKKKTISYLESDSEGTDGDDVFKPKPVSRARPTKRRRLSDSAEEDVYEQDNGEEQDEGRWTNLGVSHC
ncbi:DNA mismatch repair protein msh6, partial [Exophiala xenobiotica]